MAIVTDLRRIVIEDFSKEEQAMATKLANVYNGTVEQLVSALNKGIDFNNLNQQYAVFTLTVDGAGKPTIPIQLKYELKTRIKGCHVILATNLTDSTYPTAAPFISYSISGNQMSIDNVAGLPANKKFQLSTILYG